MAVPIARIAFNGQDVGYKWCDDSEVQLMFVSLVSIASCFVVMLAF